MTASRVRAPSRVVRTFAASAMCVTSALSLAATAWPLTAAAAGNGSGSSVNDLQTQATELADQINAENQTIDKLDAAFDAGQIAYARLQTQQAGLEKMMAASSRQVEAARAALKRQALMAYYAGGAPIINVIPDSPGSDPSLTVSYAAIVAGGEKSAVDQYRATLATQAAQQAALDANSKQEAVTLADIRHDRDTATITLAAERQSLSQVNGQLAVALAAVQAQQQAAQQAQEKATLAAQGQLPPSSPADASTQTASVAPSPTAPAPTPSRPPATSSSTVAAKTPSTAAPTPSSPPSTAPPTTTPSRPSGGSGVSQAPGVNSVLAYARAQLGKPYQWGGAGPSSFDCSGLVMM
ncbi:MAG TPA: NlpC/P60 family protein, partial [Acidimicrobiales bacterium]|nr:NlpC/P60 family protein [Acidimicrobiales bacterium]